MQQLWPCRVTKVRFHQVAIYYLMLNLPKVPELLTPDKVKQFLMIPYTKFAASAPL